MQWQDIVISVGGVILSLALLPSVFGKDKPPLSTSLLTGVILLTFAVTYYTLSLTFAFVSVGSNGVLWMILAWQKWRYKG